MASFEVAFIEQHERQAQTIEADKWSSNEDWVYFLREDNTQIVFFARSEVFSITPMDGETPHAS